MPRMTGAQAIVKSIRQRGVDTVFAIPGVQIDHLFNAFYDEGDGLRVINTRHEQGAGYMALGYAQSTGRVGTYAVVPGPGFLNSTAALATAYACNAPVLAIVGQIPSAMIGRGLGALHEIPDQLTIAQGLTKWAQRIDHPSEAPDRVREAFKQLTTGRPRPVEIEMPMDVMGLQAQVSLLDEAAEDAAVEPDPDLVDAAARLLGQAERPLIIVGSGALDAPAELLEIAELLQAPVVSTRAGRGAISDRHYLAHTSPAGHQLWAAADVVLGIGTRLFQRLTWGTDEGQKIVRIDIDPTQMSRLSRPAVGIVADARRALQALIPATIRQNRQRASRKTELSDLKAAMAAKFAKLGPQMAYLRAIRAELPEDGFFVDELTQVGYVSRFAFPVYQPRTFVTTAYQGTLGYGFPTALGVQVANPDKKVLSICGDGGFMFNIQELATAVKHRIGVVTVVFNDNAFGNVRRMQSELYEGRVLGSDLQNPDFVKLAESFGAAAFRAKTPDELQAALRTAFAEPGPSLIEVPVGEMPDPWHLINLPRVRPAATN